MKLLSIFCNLIFIAAIFHSRFSGNDKAPVLVLYTLAIAFIAFVFLASKKRWKFAIASALPLIYFFLVVILSRLGWIDPMKYIGFR